MWSTFVAVIVPKREGGRGGTIPEPQLDPNYG
jgi:hypothetical protein